MFVLRDLEGLTDQTIALSPSGMLIASLLNGQNTAGEIQSQFSKWTGTFLQVSEIHSLIEQLNKSQLLETPEIQTKRRQIFEEFAASPVRKALHQGRGYPVNTLELASFLGAFFRDPKGPGVPLPDSPKHPNPVLGLVSPHIDFHRGGPAYAWAYQALAQYPAPDVILALGVAHTSPNSPWVMTQKAYETSYGPVSVDRELYEVIKSHLWYDPLDDEWVHRGEHSLEFQAVWLKFLWREKTPSWVPILCSSFDRFCPDRPPSTVATIERAIVGIGESLQVRLKKGQKIMVLAGVDLAHVGPCFGDEKQINAELEKKVETEDRASFEHALRLDADRFYLSVVSNSHWRRVCGLSALYTSLRWIKALSPAPQTSPKLLTYGQVLDPRGGLVSFASAIFP